MVIEMKYLLYIHISPNNKKYIGITTKSNVKERWRNGNGYKHNEYFTKAIKKYGWKNFKHIVLFSDLTENEAKQKEIELIEKYKTTNKKYGYNMSLGGEGANGFKHTKEQIQKQKNNRKKPLYTEEYRKKVSKIYKDVWQREGYREKMSNIHKLSYKNGRKPTNKGNKLTLETIQKIKQTRKVKYIKCIETGVVYRGTRDVAEKLKVDRRSVMRVLRKEYGFKSVKGYHFKYVDVI